MDERSHEVWLDRKLASGCLNPDDFANASDLCCESFLFFKCAYVLYDAIRESHIKTCGGEFQLTSITFNALEIRVLRFDSIRQCISI